MNSISEGVRYVTVVTSTVFDNLESGPEAPTEYSADAVLLMTTPAGRAAFANDGNITKMNRRRFAFLNPYPKTKEMNRERRAGR